MGTFRRLGFTFIIAIFTLLATSAVFAQDENTPAPPSGANAPPSSAENDPPGRAARLDYMSGEVSIQPGGVNDWVAGTLNRPMTTADRIWTDKDSRAEVQVGSGTFRMDAETSVTLSNVSDNTVQIELDQGTLFLHVRDLLPGEIYEIDTPNTAFTVIKGGDYRLNVNSNNDVSLVTVWHGEGMATGDGPSVKIKSGEQGSFSGGKSMAHTVYPAPGRTGFDDWCAVRDKRQDSSLSARYVAPGVVGAPDLDGYGTWRTYPGYGPVWVPTVVAPGWAPYRFGHWVWVAPWGWTWVDDAPWGYAPFHYGRWAFISGSWGWCPGPIYARPVYAPALVAWVGGPGFGVSFGIGGGVGWFPLGFGEPFVPWYHAGPGYWRNVNVSNTRITNVTVINNYYNNRGSINNIHYANRAFPNAVTAVPQRAFVNSQSVGRNMVPVSGENLRNAHIVGGAGFEPSRTSVLGANAGRAAAIPPQRAFARQPVRNMTPPAAPASPFNNGRSNVANGAGGNPAGASRMPERNQTMGGPENGHQNVAETTNGRSVPRPPTVFDRTNGSNATPNNGGSSAPHPSTVFNNNGNRNNSDTPTRTPNTEAGRTPNYGQPNAGQPNSNQNVAHPYPHPPSAGERQPMGNNPGNTQNQPAHTYTASPSQNQGGPAHTNSAPPANQPQRSYSPPANQAPHTYSQPEGRTPAGQPQANQPRPSYTPPPNQAPRTYSAPEGRAPAAQPPANQQHSKPPANQKNDKPEHERNTASVYGGSSSGYMANNYNYPRPTPGAVRSAPATNYSSGNSYSGSSQRGYSAPSNGYSQRSYSAPSRETYGYAAPSRTSTYSAPTRAYNASPAYSSGRSYSAPSNGGGRSYSAPSHSAPSGGGRSAGSVAHSSGGGHSGGGSTHGH
jgi:hypothetical protein